MPGNYIGTAQRPPQPSTRVASGLHLTTPKVVESFFYIYHQSQSAALHATAAVSRSVPVFSSVIQHSRCCELYIRLQQIWSPTKLYVSRLLFACRGACPDEAHRPVASNTGSDCDWWSSPIFWCSCGSHRLWQVRFSAVHSRYSSKSVPV